MSLGLLLLLTGILFFITPMAMTWSKFGEVNEDSILNLMMSLSMDQMQLLRKIQQSGIAFIFIGASLLLMGF